MDTPNNYLDYYSYSVEGTKEMGKLLTPEEMDKLLNYVVGDV